MKKKILNLNEVMKSIGTKSKITAFRKLHSLECCNSYNKAGKYYTLPDIPSYDKNGIWSFKNIQFSTDGTLLDTICRLVKNSSAGYFCSELEELLYVKCGNSLTKLFNDNILCRSQLKTKYLYLWPCRKAKQLNKRKRRVQKEKLIPGYKGEEIYLHLQRFLSVLNEKQRRLFLGFESLRYGHGGDKAIAAISGVNRKTRGKGRGELESKNIDMERIRKKGGGRPGLKKKNFSNY